MKLQTKVLLILGSMWIVISIMMFIDSQLVIKRNYQKLENELIVDNIHDVQKAFNKTLSTLSLYTLAWAQWDEAYLFMQAKHEQFIKSNFVPGTYASSEINFFLFFDKEGKFFYGKEYDLQENKFVDISSELIAFLEKKNDFVIHNKVKSEKSGLLNTPNGYIVMSSMPVIKGDGTGPVLGSILMGYYLSDEKIQALAETVDIGLKFHAFPLKTDNVLLKEAFEKLSEGNEYYLYQKNKNMAYGYVFLKDFNQQPIGLLEMGIPRSVYLQGLSTIWHYFAIVSLLGITVLVLIWYLLKKFVLDRVINVSQQVTAISREGNFARRIRIGGDDELGDLVGSINQMMRLISISQDKLEYMAHHDSLTGLPNRISFYHILKNEIDKAERSGKKIAVLFVDMDRLKDINDLYGHDVGDKIIQHNADLLRMNIRKSDTVCRLAGDEFVICCPDLESIQIVDEMIKRFLEAASKPINIEGNMLKLTFSIGVSLYPKDGTSVDALLKHSDEAMYVAKRRNGNAYHFFSDKKDNIEA